MFTKVLYIFYLLTFIFVSLWKSTRIFRSYFNFPECRFYPSCSEYFLGAVKKHGLFCGLVLGCKRLLRCHPLCEGGIDEVPS